MARVIPLVKILRIARGITAAEAAKEVGINPTDYRKVENGQLRASNRVRGLLETQYRAPWSKLSAPASPGALIR